MAEIEHAAPQIAAADPVSAVAEATSSKMIGSGTREDLFQPRSREDLNTMTPGQVFRNPSDGRLLRFKGVPEPSEESRDAPASPQGPINNVEDEQTLREWNFAKRYAHAVPSADVTRETIKIARQTARNLNRDGLWQAANEAEVRKILSGRRAAESGTENRGGFDAAAQHQLFKVGSALTPAAQRQRTQVEDELTRVIRRIAGDSVRVAFPDKIGLPRGAAGWGSAGKNVETAAGSYMPAEPLIKIAMADPAYTGDKLSTALHESFHHVHNRLLLSKERKLLEREMPRLRRYIDKHVASDLPEGGQDFRSDELADYEVVAVAFEHYAALRADGRATSSLPVSVREMFDRLLELFHQVRNALHGLGFQTYEDVFDAAYDGEYARRFDRQNESSPPDIVWPDDSSQAQPAIADSRVMDRVKGVEEGAGREDTTTDDRTSDEVFNIRSGRPDPFTPNDAAGAKEAADDMAETLADDARSADQRAGVVRGALRALKGWREAPQLPRTPDLGWYGRSIMHPRTIAMLYPSFTPIWNAAQRMFEVRDDIASELGRMWGSYHSLETADQVAVDKVLQHGRLMGEVYDGDISITNRYGDIKGRDGSVWKIGEKLALTEAQRDGYAAIRHTMDHALNLFRAQVLREVGLGSRESPYTTDEVKRAVEARRERFGPGEAKKFDRLIATLEEIDAASREGYIPFSRYGQIGIAVKDSLGDTAHFEKFEVDVPFGKRAGRWMFKGQVAQRRAELEREYPASEGFRISEPFELTSQLALRNNGISISDIDALAEVGNVDDAAYETVRASLVDALKTRGFLKHFLGSKNTPGYSVDFERSIADYITGVSGYLARRLVNDELEDAVAGIPAGQPLLRRYARDYANYIRSPHEEWQRLRAITFLYYLSGNVSSATVNVTQVPVITMPYLSQFGSYGQINGQLARAYKDAGLMLGKPENGKIPEFIPENAPADVREDLKKAWDRGILVPQITYEQMGLAQGRRRLMRGLRKDAAKTFETLGLMFSGVERMNRVVTYIAAHRLARNPTFVAKAKAQLERNPLWRSQNIQFTPHAFAEWVIDETHYRIGKLNRGKFLRGPGTAIFQFKSFTLNTLELMYRMMRDDPAAAARLGAGATGRGAVRLVSSRKALVGMAAMLTMFGGLFGLPGGDDGRELVEAAHKFFRDRDIDFEQELYGLFKEVPQGPMIAEMIARGPVRQLGIDVSRRVGMGNILPTETVIRDEAGPLLGMPYEMLIGRSKRAIEFLKDDQKLLAAGEAVPNFIKNPIHAYSWATSGVKTKGRQLMTPTEITTTEALVKSLGFQPTSVARKRELEWSVRRASNESKDFQARYYKQLGRALAKDDTPEFDRIFKEIDAYNAKRPTHQWVVINPDALRKMVAQEMFGTEAGDRNVPRKARERVDEIRQSRP